MTPRARQLILTVLIAFAAGLLGAWGGLKLGQRDAPPTLHESVHRDFDLSPQQDARLDALEAAFASRRAALEAEMRAANADLAAAIRQEHAYGPRVTAAVDRFHMAMGALQKATIEHVFAMRAVLTPEQAARFDVRVGRALTQGGA